MKIARAAALPLLALALLSSCGMPKADKDKIREIALAAQAELRALKVDEAFYVKGGFDPAFSYANPVEAGMPDFNDAAAVAAFNKQAEAMQRFLAYSSGRVAAIMNAHRARFVEIFRVVAQDPLPGEVDRFALVKKLGSKKAWVAVLHEELTLLTENRLAIQSFAKDVAGAVKETNDSADAAIGLYDSILKIVGR
jgi:hypothetical protein